MFHKLFLKHFVTITNHKRNPLDQEKETQKQTHAKKDTNISMYSISKANNIFLNLILT